MSNRKRYSTFTDFESTNFLQPFKKYIRIPRFTSFQYFMMGSFKVNWNVARIINLKLQAFNHYANKLMIQVLKFLCYRNYDCAYASKQMWRFFAFKGTLIKFIILYITSVSNCIKCIIILCQMHIRNIYRV